MFTPQQVHRFWAHVDRRGANECWPWLASRRKDGRGQVKIGGKVRKAHQVSYEIAKGERNPLLEIRHTCNNPDCVNPDHLIQGTHAQNMDDFARSGQSAQKLTPSDVATILADRAAGDSLRAIARRFSVTHRTIAMVVDGTSHRYHQGRQATNARA